MTRLIALAVCMMAAGASCRHVNGPEAMSKSPSRAEDLRAIDLLHKMDKRATLALDTDALLDLWADDGVMLRPGSPPVVGKQAIAEVLRKWNPDPDAVKIIRNTIDLAEVNIIGDLAIEYGTYESVWQNSNSNGPQTVSGNILRVLQRQPDGSWKYARAIWNTHEPQ